jgi:anionic cell wall polymer biosynthesis LytR-Cps2A-Psr (LCP) family protein
MVASLNYDKKTISLFSVPRDLYVEYPTGGA